MFKKFFNKKMGKESLENADFTNAIISDGEIRELLKTAIGPAPWYWNTFPEITTKAGIKYKWNYDEKKAEWIPYLEKVGENDCLLMGVDTYLRAFSLPTGYLGIWYPRSVPKPYEFLGVEFEFFDLEKLEKFTLIDIPKDFKKLKNPYFCKGNSLTKFFIPKNLKPGENNFKFPEVMKAMDEFVMVCGYPYEKAAYSILQLLPKNNKVVLYPQYWFNEDECDLGYQWITRIIKHPKNGQFYGDGIRISAFELKKDGVSYSRVIK